MTRIPPTVTVVVLGTVLAAFAFQWGRATASQGSDDRRRTPVVEAVAHAGPAVVSVIGIRGRTSGSGSGVFVHPDGYVVTNSHVIRAAQSITVKPFRQRQRYHARVVADNPSGDLAILKVEGGGQWPYVSLVPSSQVLLGETAIAIGNPRGMGDTITVGVVSATGRTAKVQNGSTIKHLIQTDAAINSGSSGGPLLNLDGELIGINASMLPQAKGISFAIAADDVAVMLRRVLGSCAPPNPLPPCAPLPPPVSLGGVRPPTVRPTPSPRPAPAPSRMPTALPDLQPETVPLTPGDVGLLIRDDGRRLVIEQVRPGSPAAKAGVLVGDHLLDVDQLAIEDLGDVRLAFAASFPGRLYDLRLRRGKASKRVLVQIPR